MPKQKTVREILKPLGETCVEFRFRNNKMAQAALASKAKVSDKFLSDIENNHSENISVNKMISVAKAVGLNVEVSFVSAKK